MSGLINPSDLGGSSIPVTIAVSPSGSTADGGQYKVFFDDISLKLHPSAVVGTTVVNGETLTLSTVIATGTSTLTGASTHPIDHDITTTKGDDNYQSLGPAVGTTLTGNHNDHNTSSIAPSSSGHLSPIALSGIVVGSLVALTLLILFYILYRRSRSTTDRLSPYSPYPFTPASARSAPRPEKERGARHNVNYRDTEDPPMYQTEIGGPTIEDGNNGSGSAELADISDRKRVL